MSADTQLPPAISRGMKVCISSLDKAQSQHVRRMALELGAIPTAFRAGADVVILADGASENETEMARKEGFAVFTISGFSRMARGAEQERPAFEVGENSVRILDQTIALEKVCGPYVPEAGRFRHLCFDSLFLTTARKAALAVSQGIPCMLEGETATAKTTSILWLAMLCNHDVIRINLNGQTDTGELVGRYVPATSGRGKSWTFREGYIPQALRKGWWVILDEVNLAEPQVLERLNPVLEDPATLVLTEHDGTRFGTGADMEVAEGFRIFGTMNPAEYAGRSPLSPAFRDRWGIWGHDLLDRERRLRYHDLLNVLEDMRIEAWLASHFPGCAPWLALANRIFGEEDRKIAWPPELQIQFLRGLLEECWFGEVSQGPAPMVLEALAGTREAVAEMKGCIPPPAPGRAAAREILHSQQGMLTIFLERILPVWEKLVEADAASGHPRHTFCNAPALVAAGYGTTGRFDARARAIGNPSRDYLSRQRALAGLIDPLADELIHLFQLNGRSREVRGQPSGSRIDLRSVMQFEADPRLYDKIWIRQKNHQRFDPAIFLLLDTSVSMKGEKFEGAFDGLVLLSEVCMRAGLPLSV